MKSYRNEEIWDFEQQMPVSDAARDVILRLDGDCLTHGVLLLPYHLLEPRPDRGQRRRLADERLELFHLRHLFLDDGASRSEGGAAAAAALKVGKRPENSGKLITAGMNIYSRASAEGKRVQIGGRQYIDIPGRYIYTQHLKGSKACKGSTWIPIFDVGDEFDAGTLSRKIMGFTYYGRDGGKSCC